MPYTVYTLADPRGFVRYVGLTTSPLPRRLSTHVRDANSGHASGKAVWIRELLTAGYRPRIEALEEYEDRARGLSGEREWIQTLRYLGCDLANHNEGGTGKGWTHATLVAHSLRRVGEKRTPETCERMRAALTGKKRTPEQCARIGASKRGLVHSPEARAKMSATHLARKSVRSPEQRAAIALGLREYWARKRGESP